MLAIPQRPFLLTPHRCGSGCWHGPHLFSRRRALQLGGAGVATMGLSGCLTTNRATGETIMTGFNSLEDDAKMGAQEHPKLVEEFGGEYENAKLQSYVERLGQELATHAEYQEFKYKFTIVNSWIVNAFALPGGYVYVSRGLLALASNEAELAGVVGHEIGHVNARHTAQRIAQSQIAQFGLLGLGILTGSQEVMNVGGSIANVVLKSFSRDQEMEADTLGLRYMTRAGYDPEAMVGFLDTLRDHSQIEAEKQGLPPETVDERNINATHPRTIERVQAAEKLAAGLKVPGQLLNRDRYLDKIDGMIYGDDPSQGLVRGTEFIHPDLRLYFKMPDGFVIQNGASRLIAQKPNEKAVVVFDQAERKTGDVYSYLTREWGKGATLNDLGRITINGLAGATGATRIDGMDYRIVVVQGDGKTVYRFRFVSDPAVTSKYDVPFRETTYSFRRLSKAEASRIKPFQLIVVPLSPGDTVASLSKGFPEGNYSQAAFRVANDLKPGQKLPSSGKVKVVVGGTGI